MFFGVFTSSQLSSKPYADQGRGVLDTGILPVLEAFATLVLLKASNDVLSLFKIRLLSCETTSFPSQSKIRGQLSGEVPVCQVVA
jgi:hypothetical protein